MFIKLTRIYDDEYGSTEEEAVINTDVIRTVTDSGLQDGTLWIELDKCESFLAKGTLDAFFETVGAKTVPFRNG